ncbi:Uncharacterised protein [Bordetella pertussis]|nr:Uncharacterised protein [Bordetella pertussis]
MLSGWPSLPDRPSSMPSSISAPMPWPLGPISCSVSSPYCAPIGSTQSAWCAARSASVSAPPVSRANAAMRAASAPR